jgi:membrane protein
MGQLKDLESGGDRGETAKSPAEIPVRGWWDIARRTVARSARNGILLVAAGVTFYGLLAIVPAVAAFITFYGLFFDPGQIDDQVRKVGSILPERAVGIVRDQLDRVAALTRRTLGLTFFTTTVISLWSALAAVRAVIKGLNIAYQEKETRSFLRLNGLALIFTFGAMAVLTVVLAGLAVAPMVLDAIGLGPFTTTLAHIVRWPILVGLVLFAVTVLYRYAPDRERPQWRWITWGSGAVAIGWFVFSLLFTWYVSNIRNYDETHGSLGAIVIFMVWMWLSTAIVLLGAELNAEMEQQTNRETAEDAPENKKR